MRPYWNPFPVKCNLAPMLHSVGGQCQVQLILTISTIKFIFLVANDDFQFWSTLHVCRLSSIPQLCHGVVQWRQIYMFQGAGNILLSHSTPNVREWSLKDALSSKICVLMTGIYYQKQAGLSYRRSHISFWWLEHRYVLTDIMTT